jgi:3-dehydroquinate synthase
MRTITVNSSRTYDVVIGAGVLKEAGAIARKKVGGHSAVIVADDNVAALYGKQLSDALASSGYRSAQYVFPHGESSKNVQTLVSVLNFLAEERLSRSDVVFALGGGVTGDLAGFAAACYMRGTGFIQIPTTLLAAVDSSVGGKTAVNLSSGKNMFGAFYQPNAVLCDVLTFSSLTPEIMSAGCAEVIKYGVIADHALFKSLETPIHTQLEDIIACCVAIKRDIVTEDEFEAGSRKRLNFGHTIGHAIELLSEYSISHGHAVAAGMAVVTRAAVRMGICEENCLLDILSMLERYELPVNTQYEADVLARVCLSDKKRHGEYLTMVFPTEIGNCVLREVPVGELETVIRLGLEDY